MKLLNKLIRWFVNQPYLLLLLSAMIWGGNAVAGKMAVGHVSPALLVSFRWIFASMIILPLAWPHLKKDWPIIRRHIPYLFVLGSVGFTLFNNIMYLALNYTSAINIGIEQASMPLIIFLLNFLIFRMRTTWLQLVGFSFTLIGIILIITRGNPLGILEQTANFGDLIMMIAVTSYAGYTVALRNKPDLHWLSFMAVLSVSALITSFLFTGIEYARGNQIAPDWYAIAIIIYIAIFPSLVSQISWIRGLELIGSNRGGIFINFVPIFSSSFAILILGERFQIFHGLALILVIGGIALAQRGAEKKQAAQE